jgi:hypothetical protein
MNLFFRLATPAAVALSLLVAVAQNAHGATLTQSGTFHTTYTSFTETISTQFLYFPNSGLASAPMNPFNASLGTLDKVTIEWNFGQSFNGLSGTSNGSGGGNFFMNIGGNFSVNSMGSYGGGSQTGSASNNSPNTVMSGTQANAQNIKDFTSADASYWTVFTGLSPYTVNCNSIPSYYALYGNVASGTSTTYRDVTVTYDYTAVPEIDPAGMGSVLALVTGTLGLLERRRQKAKRVA